MKVNKADISIVLRGFNETDDPEAARGIDQIAVSNPSPFNTAARFRFNRCHYLVLFDETAEDNVQHISQQLKMIDANIEGDLLLNPQSDFETHGVPYKGKDAYLFKYSSGKIRLDQYLATNFPQWSRSSWQKLIKDGKVTVDGTVERVPRLEVSSTQTIKFEEPTKIDPEDINIPILFIDDDYIVINKPIGMLTHPKNELNFEPTVADFFRSYTTVALDSDRPGIVHRLDRDTSGVLVGARHPQAADKLKHAFASRKVNKKYYAITTGTPKEPELIIDAPILRNPTKPGSFMVHPNGKSAKTTVKVLATKEGLSLLELTPETGRTHQLRVHLNYLGTPILGDRLYGKPADRLYLHAHSLTFPRIDGDEQTVESPMPDVFKELTAYET